jgi:hypothetical protein
MSEPQIHYDEPSDTLYVSFAPGEAATGLELNDTSGRVSGNRRRARRLRRQAVTAVSSPEQLPFGMVFARRGGVR